MLHDPALGEVLLVGAGPGSADLLTLRAARAIESAGALLYDALVLDEVVDLAPRGCVRIRTGKRAGEASMKQETINRLMLRLARRGLKVVRLKGGDPSVFGRSGEERAFLEAHGVKVEIVPGVTAASAAAAQFAFPLTHRAESRRLVLATARLTDGALQTEGWDGLVSADTTLALYMGRDAAGAVAERLIAEGRSPATPCLIVEDAGRPAAQARAADLEALGAAMADMGPSGPVVVVIGAVTAQAKAALSYASPPALRRPGLK
ncbi:uroporphyrinogen-III C-methyltransferase [Phenylobacterium montanum]|uniref:uroporphyrinogen-III C-methyltransferase n=2 Tax=Phenylobacterium montanum TaxID=2823693 RepID=A0A975IX79_9CAUL|nr:uroporphyrinogen-III C-methyltransferase [Caulobacter sp. S6]